MIVLLQGHLPFEIRQNTNMFSCYTRYLLFLILCIKTKCYDVRYGLALTNLGQEKFHFYKRTISNIGNGLLLTNYIGRKYEDYAHSISTNQIFAMDHLPSGHS